MSLELACAQESEEKEEAGLGINLKFLGFPDW